MKGNRKIRETVAREKWEEGFLGWNGKARTVKDMGIKVRVSIGGRHWWPEKAESQIQNFDLIQLKSLV